MDQIAGVDRTLLLRLARCSAATAAELERMRRQPSALTDADWRGAAATAAAATALLLRARLHAAAQHAHRLHELSARALAATDPTVVVPTRVGGAR